MVDVEVREESKTISRVDGDLNIKEGRVSTDSPDNILQVTGSVRCRGDCSLECIVSARDFEANRGNILVGGLSIERLIKVKKGELEVENDIRSGRVEVDRRLLVHGSLECTSSSVGGSMTVEGNSRAENVDVGGSLRLGRESEIARINVGGTVSFKEGLNSDRISVGGTLEGRGPLDAKRIDVGGRVAVEDRVDLGEIDVGGTVRIGGGKIGNLDVGGTFKSTDHLNFGDIEVGGKATLSGGEGGDIEVGGVLSSNGNLDFSNLEVGGKVNIAGDSRGQGLRVGGMLDVSGNLELSRSLRVGGKAEIGESVRASSIRLGGVLRASRVEASEDIEANKLMTKDGARADTIEIGKNGESRGPLIARRVWVEDKASVEDVYADEVEMRKGSRANNIYAKRIEIDSRSRVNGEVKFTEALNAGDDVNFARDPERVEELPSPPSEEEGCQTQ